MKKEIFRAADGTEIPILIPSLTSNGTILSFRIQDAIRPALESLLLDPEKTAEFELLTKDTDTLQEETLIKYGGYTTLRIFNTEFGKIVGYDYDTPDETTESGYTEITTAETYVELYKKTLLERRVERVEGMSGGGDPEAINALGKRMTGVENDLKAIGDAITGGK